MARVARRRLLRGGQLRVATVVLALLAAQLGALAWPAHACGCGGMVSQEGERIAVEQETSAVRWDGGTEEIVMRLNVSGDASEAAWVMPVPNRASVKLGERELFDQLERLTAPVDRERHYFWPRPGDWPRSRDDGGEMGQPPGEANRPVDVVGRERLGPFDVVRLTATDPAALEGWLSDNGFDLPERIARELKPYVDNEWEYVATRLAPRTDSAGRDGGGSDRGSANGDGASQSDVLRGDLDPLHISFASDELVYPMRLSRAAEKPQSLRMYVLSPHRMEPRGRIGGQEPEVLYAGRLKGDTDGEETAEIRAFGGSRADFVTALEQEFPEPSEISGDHRLREARSDEEYQRVNYRDTMLTWAGIPAWIVTVTGAIAVVVAVLMGFSGRGRRSGGARR